MKRVLASVLFLATALQAATAVPQNSAASQQPRLVSVAQSPYDFRFHVEQGEWDQVDAALRRIPTNYQFDAYKGNTPLMMVIDLFAHKVADKPKSIWQTAVGGVAKACGGAALVVIGLAFALRAKNNWNAAKPAAPKAPRVAPVDPKPADVDDADESDDEAEEKGAAAQPRVRQEPPPYEDQTEAIRQKMDAAKKEDQHRAAQEQKDLDAKKRAADGAAAAAQNSYFKVTPLAERLRPAVDNLKSQIHDIRYQDFKPALHTVEEAAMDIKNRAAAFAASAQGGVEDARDAMHEAKKEAKNLSKKAKKVLKSTNQAAKKAGDAAKKIGDAAEQIGDAAEKIGIAAECGTEFYTNGSVILRGLGGFGLLFTGLWSGWKGFKDIKSLVGLPKREQDLKKFRSLIVDLLHRQDINLGAQNSDGETALQMIRRHMAEHIDDRENYQLLSEVEQLIMIRSA
jgi:hypothetical protein